MVDAKGTPQWMMLADAAALYGMKPQSLRREASKGNLETSLVAGKLWTTEAAMEAMFERCRRPAKPTPIETSPPLWRSGASTGSADVSQAALKATLEKLAASSPSWRKKR